MRQTKNIAVRGPTVHAGGRRRLVLALTAVSLLTMDRVEARAQDLPCAVWVVRNALESPASWARALDAVRPLAAALLLPYAAWVGFAGYLNGGIWYLNR